MIKRYFKVLLCGGLLLSATGFVSCNDDDIDDLKSRMSVVEGMISQLKTAMESGATVTEATQDANGVWTLKLSNGVNIVLSGGGGGNVSVIENEDNIIIKVDGKEYILPKGTAAASLIYRPVYSDGQEIMNDMKSIPVNFLISGDVFEASKITEVDIVDAYALTTRAASNLLQVVEGSAVVNGNVLTVSIMPGEALEAGKTYNANVRIKVGSKEYFSNYFQIKVSEGFVYDNAAPQDQIDAFAAADGLNATIGEDGASKLIIFADELPSMEGEVDFAKYFKGLPEGANFMIASQATEEGLRAFDALRNSLSKNGKFSWAQRPGTAFPNGFRITVQNKEGQTIGKADFKYSDPLDASVDWTGVFASGKGGHIEIIGGDKQPYSWLAAGANDIDLQEIFAKAIEDGRDNTTISPMHDGGRFIYEQFGQYSAGDYVYFDGTRWVLTDEGQKLAQASAGVKWVSYQISVGSSNRRNIADRPADEGNDANIDWCGGNCNGELMWDGINDKGKEMLGISLRPDGHLITTDAYKGWNMRVGLWAYYEYLYGEKEIGGGDALVWIWINRRCCPEGTNDALITEAQKACSE